jgi:hypothetical protein
VHFALQLDVFLVKDSPRASNSAFSMVLASVLVTGVLDGVSQPAVFVDAALAGPTYTHVSVDNVNINPRPQRAGNR